MDREGKDMGQYRVNIASPNLVNICIDVIAEGEYSGRIYDKYEEGSVPFRDSGQMISVLDRFFDALDYPQASTRYRSFQRPKKGEPSSSGKKEGLVQVHTAEEILEHKGKEATFILNVQFRQNSTWQGKLIWVEAEDEEPFCSVLELLKLLDSALMRE